MEIVKIALLCIAIVLFIVILFKTNKLKRFINKFVSKDSTDYALINELYAFRLVYNAASFNLWAKHNPEYMVHKSKRHYDGEQCFGGGWFIVVAKLPTGQISNHYKMEHWDLFKIPEENRVLFAFDNHTPQDVLKRIIDKEIEL